MTAAAVNFILTCTIRSDDVYFVAGALFHIALAVPIAFWMAGAKVVLANFEPKSSLDMISREGVTQMVATGTIFKMLIEEMESNPRPLRMRLMYCGGAPVSPQLVRRAEQAFRC
jgi:acyl-CoA synthetase (AMP-forming)/AMP-acid ligase II